MHFHPLHLLPKPDRLSKEVVDLALELLRRRPWERVLPEAPMRIRIPGVDEEVVAVIAGQDGTAHGLMVVRGEGAFEALLDWLHYQRDPESIPAARTLFLFFEPLGETPVPLRGLAADAGLRPTRDR